MKPLDLGKQPSVETQNSTRRYASEVINNWPLHRPFTARSVFEAHPELAGDRVFRIDVVYEEYRQRRDAGESVDIEGFGAAFPDIKHSLLWYISVIEHFEKNPHLLQPGDVRWPEAGEEFLNFRLTTELGHGGFSRVFLAEDTALGGREVVLKICQRGDTEAGVLGQLEHPHIVPVLSAATDDQTGLSAICMPFLTGATLLHILDFAWSENGKAVSGETIRNAVDDSNRQFDGRIAASTPGRFCKSFVDMVVQLGLQLAEALDYSHSRGFFHCDIKPSNVLVTPDGSALLFDFNLSFRASEKNQNVGGTIPYMAPEQLHRLMSRPDDVSDLDGRADIFSLGVTLYEFLTGVLPFGPLPSTSDRDTLLRTLHNRQREGPISLRKVWPRIDSSLVDLVESCLAFDPDDRPASGAEVAPQLRRYFRPSARLRRWAGEHRTSAAVAAAAPVLLAAAGAFWLITRDPYAVRIRKQAEAAFLDGRTADSTAMLTSALQSASDNTGLLFARGRVHLAAGNVQAALQDFESLDAQITEAQITDGRVTACLACCHCLAGDNFERALALHRRAEREGFVSAGFLSNMGYCHFRLRQYSMANRCFERAIEIDSELQIALFHRAMTELEPAITEKRVPDTRWIERAVSTGPPSAEVFERLAVTCAAGFRFTPAEQRSERTRWADRVGNAFRDAVAYGSNSQTLSGTIITFDRELREIVQAESEAARDIEVLPGKKLRHIVDPLGEFPDQLSLAQLDAGNE